MKLQFRTAASADMRRVARETRLRWGEEQAAIYTDTLRQDIKSLLVYPLRYPEYTPSPGLRRMNCGKHAVFYLVGENQIEVIRVLHAASDFESLLT